MALEGEMAAQAAAAATDEQVEETRYGSPNLEHVRQSQPWHRAIYEAVRRRNDIAGGVEIAPGSSG